MTPLFSSMLEDKSEQVKMELARIVGQLSCIQSELSKVSDIHTESTDLPKVLCLRCSLATEHAGKAVPSLRASVVRPFLPLLGPQAASRVKQGTYLFSYFLKLSFRSDRKDAGLLKFFFKRVSDLHQPRVTLSQHSSNPCLTSASM